VAPAAVGYLVIWLGAQKPPRWLVPARDRSYGLYLLAFPVQQTLALIGVYQEGLLTYSLATLLLTLPLAWLCERLVERPALRLRDLALRIPGRAAPGS
jgi:peptidoglycan/LPS O-acetylase OafA/YrhL